MSKLAFAAAMISFGICSFVTPSSQAAIPSPMSSEVRDVLPPSRQIPNNRFSPE
jgi:hypothetical protein